MDLTAAIQYASSVLFRLSGRQWPGICEQTIWPCQGSACSGGGDAGWATLAASDWHFGQSAPSIPYRTADGWANCWDCGQSMGSSICGGGCYLPSLKIPGYIQEVYEVVVHGERLPRSAYAIKERSLVRIDGGSWPCSNNLTGPFPFTDGVFTLTVAATSGTYTVSIDSPTGSIPVSLGYASSAVAVRSALEAVLGAGSVAVGGGPGDAGGTSPYTITISSYRSGYAPGLTIDTSGLTGTAFVNVVEEGFAPPTDSWYVTYAYGKPPPPDGQFAASKFACEIALAACGSDACQLPARMRSIVREGVEMTFADPLEFIGKGEVGIYEVDLWLNSVNPKKLQRRSSVYRADAPKAPERFRRG